MIVADTSALVGALLAYPEPSPLAERLKSASVLHAPHLLDIEFLHALRRLAHTDFISDLRAEIARSHFSALTIRRYSHAPLFDRIWQLRHNLSACDGAFVALAELLDLPLITSDSRLARASGHNARVELFVVPVLER